MNHKNIILILTRYFDSNNIASKSPNISNKEHLNKLIEILNKDVVKNKQNKTFYFKGTNILQFIECLRNHFKDDDHKINSHFSGELKRFPSSKIFFYHHWFDKQINHQNDNGRIIFYLRKILEEIISSVQISDYNQRNDGLPYTIYLFLHDGDFLSNDKGEKILINKISLFNDDFLLEEGKNLFVNGFSHNIGDYVWKVINNEELVNELEGKSDKESYLLNLILPDKIDESYEAFIDS
ncbi:MAG TPA: hypothetical protein VK250_12455 [Nitrososphaeraceae archaeon]|jgi:hypothetical protein|nr:hypothetical protein [Nitrososphaeraceae archaeon]